MKPKKKKLVLALITMDLLIPQKRFCLKILFLITYSSSGHPEAQPNNQPQTLVQARPPDSNNLQRSDPVIDRPKIPPQTPTAEEPTVDSATLNLTSTPSPMRQLLGQDLFRLVQVRTNTRKNWT